MAECSAISGDKCGTIRLGNYPTKTAFALVNTVIRGNKNWFQCSLEEIFQFDVYLEMLKQLCFPWIEGVEVFYDGRWSWARVHLVRVINVILGDPKGLTGQDFWLDRMSGLW